VSQHKVLAAGVQLGAAIQAQTLVRVESNLVEHESSIKKIADTQRSGFARVDDDLDVIRGNVGLVRVDVNSLDVSMKFVLERLEVLESQNTARDKLIDHLNCCMTKLSEALVQCSCGEYVLKISSGSGRREDPFELEEVDRESGDGGPQGSSPEAEEAAGPILEHEMGLMVSHSGGVQGEDEEDVVVEDSEEERERGSSSPDESSRGIVMSSPGTSLPHLPEVREEPEGPSHAGSGQGSVRSGGHPRGSSFHPYHKAKSVRDGSSFSLVRRRSSLIPSDVSCHCDGNHSEVESDGSGVSFLTDHSVEMGFPFLEGTPVVHRTKLDRRLMPSGKR